MEPKSVQITRRLWLGLGALLIVSFSIMLWIGKDIYQTAPPMPEQVITESGQVLYSKDEIQAGRRVWQEMGGQQTGSIWGHGALIAPDWSAEWLHKEILAMLDVRARVEFGMPYDTLSDSEKAKLQAEIKPEIRANTYDPATGDIVVSDERALAISQVAAHYMSVFSNDPATRDLRPTRSARTRCRTRRTVD